MLHAGGKFGGEGYKISGGLHGVGVSVVNALSRRLELEIHRDGGKFGCRRSSNGGEPAGPARARRRLEAARHHVTFWPDPHDLRGDRVPRPDAARAAARDGVPQQGPRDPSSATSAPTRSSSRSFKYDGGIVDFVRHLNASKEPLFKRVVVVRATPTTNHEVEIAMQWNTGYYEGIHSFANNIATTEGGMHEEGFKKALTNVVNRYAQGQGPPQGEGREPPRRGHPRGPHRDRLGEAAQPAVRGPDQDQARQHRDALARREGHQREARRLARGAPDRGRGDRREGDAGAHARAWRRARRATSRGASRCSSRRRCRASSPTARRATRRSRELFIVEGDSAGGSAKKARDPRVQAILPIRGKILNVERARLDKMLKNEEIQALITAIGRGHRRRLRPRRSSATTRSSSWPTPTSTARTSARCCSRSSTGSCPSS